LVDVKSEANSSRSQGLVGYDPKVESDMVISEEEAAAIAAAEAARDAALAAAEVCPLCNIPMLFYLIIYKIIG